MKNTNRLLSIISFLGIFLLFPLSPSPALDTTPGIQDRYSSSSTGKMQPPSSTGQETFKKQQPTTDQKFNMVFSKITGLEQTVSQLQNQVNAQAQLIAQLKQIISVNSSGTVTIQSPGALKITAGGSLKMAGSTIDLNAAITGAHGILKADTMMTKTVIAQSYTPGAGNIW
jgi:TolA-binding protein